MDTKRLLNSLYGDDWINAQALLDSKEFRKWHKAGMPSIRTWVQAGMPPFVQWLESPNLDQYEKNLTLRPCDNCSSAVTSVGKCLACENPSGSVTFFDELEGADALSDQGVQRYKVVSLKDKFLTSKFDPSVVERALNDWARLGWRLIAVVSSDMPGIGGARNEVIMFLEKDTNG